MIKVYVFGIINCWVLLWLGRDLGPVATSGVIFVLVNLTQ
jgi:hypothetical protein